MAANYPSSLPVKDPAGANLASNPHSVLHDGVYDEVVAIGTELGTNPKGTAATVKARLDSLTPTSDVYTPTLTASTTNPALGSGGSTSGNWSRQGDLVTVWARIVFGSSGVSAGSGVYIVSLPIACTLLVSSSSNGLGASIGSGFLRDSSALSNNQPLAVQLRTSTSVQFIHNAGAVTDSSPNTWSTGDVITFSVTYSAA